MQSTSESQDGRKSEIVTESQSFSFQSPSRHVRLGAHVEILHRAAGEPFANRQERMQPQCTVAFELRLPKPLVYRAFVRKCWRRSRIVLDIHRFVARERGLDIDQKTWTDRLAVNMPIPD